MSRNPVGAKLKSKKKPGKQLSFKHLLRTLPFILIVAILVFSPALTNEFVNWDDFDYITRNPLIRDISLANILHLFDFNTQVVGNYHPLTVLTYGLEYKLAGATPFLYHFDDILLHLANTSLFCLLAWRLTGHYYAVVIATILFAIHPMRVESVVWAAERKDVLYGFFFLISLLLYVRFLRSNNQKLLSYLLCLLFFLLSILSKAQAVVLPLVLILLDYWFLNKVTAKNFIQKIPFFILALVFGLLATKAQSSSLTAERMIHFGLFDRIFFASYNLLAYPFKFLFPYRLATFYGYPAKSQMLFYYACLPIVLLLMSFIIYRFKKNKLVIFSILFFLSTIFIVIQLLPIGNAIIADRYTYIPYISFFILAGELVHGLLLKKPRLTNAVLAIVSIQLILFGISSYVQSKTWKNSETLWLQVLKVNPKEPTAQNNLGVYYFERGNADAAASHFLECIENSENYLELYKAYNNLGTAYEKQKKYDSALLVVNKSIELQPNFPDAVFTKGLVLSDMKEYARSTETFTQLLTTDSLNANAYYSRAIAFRGSNKIDSAVMDYEQAIRINPGYADAYTNLGNIYFNQQNMPLAIKNYSSSLDIRPDGNTYLNRSKAFYFLDKYQEALEDYDRAAQNNASEPAFLDAIKAKMHSTN